MMSSFWSTWIIVITLGSIIGCLVLLHYTRKMPGSDKPDELVGHSFDGIEEYNNPLPYWWLIMFYGSIAFGLLYLAYYPLGNWKGLGNWTSIKQYEAEVAAHEAKYDQLFSKYAAMPIEELAKDKKAIKMGQRIFANNCALCHGSNARGTYGFPNLTDQDWLYGNDAASIKTTVLNGRQGQMPGWSAILGDQGVEDVVNYVQKISSLEVSDADAALRGEKIFASVCAGCHGKAGEGLTSVGAPNLTDDIWLYGNTPELIRFSIQKGRNGNMPPHKDIIGEEKAHIVSAYVYSLSNP